MLSAKKTKSNSPFTQRYRLCSWGSCTDDDKVDGDIDVALVLTDDSSDFQPTGILGRSSARGVRLAARQIRRERGVCRHCGEYSNRAGKIYWTPSLDYLGLGNSGQIESTTQFWYFVTHPCLSTFMHRPHWNARFFLHSKTTHAHLNYRQPAVHMLLFVHADTTCTTKAWFWCFERKASEAWGRWGTDDQGRIPEDEGRAGSVSFDDLSFVINLLLKSFIFVVNRAVICKCFVCYC